MKQVLIVIVVILVVVFGGLAFRYFTAEISGASDQYFFFDAETDAFIELKGLNYILMDQPLSGINTPRLKVEVTDN